MEQLMVTPMRPFELVMGKLLPFAMVGVLEVAFVILAALAVFRIPIRGSIPLVFGCSLLFLLSTLGVGLFISTISKTQQQAMMASFFFFMPAMLLSGFDLSESPALLHADCARSFPEGSWHNLSLAGNSGAFPVRYGDS
jgi:ABC-2 type transport system permease protein